MKNGTSPWVLMAQDSPSSAAAATAESDARLASEAAALGATSAAAVDLNDDTAVRDAAKDEFAAAPAAPAISCGFWFGGAGRRRQRTSLALGPAAGTRRSISRWRMRSALICQMSCKGECRRAESADGGGDQGMEWQRTEDF
jgi:hypothetical protein